VKDFIVILKPLNRQGPKKEKGMRARQIHMSGRS